MANSYFRFKQFTVEQDRCAMKVTTDASLFGAWVADQLAQSFLPARNILDIGTGTGLLSLMLAQKTNALMDAVEIDEVTAQQAVENVNTSPWRERIKIIHGDINILSNSISDRYDIIISNPPFYENELATGNLQKNMAHHDSGLVLEELLNVIKQLLNPNGRFFLLLPYKRMTEVGSLLNKWNFEITRSLLVKQSTRHDYFRIFIEGRAKNNEAEKNTKEELSIWDNQQQYTENFISLLKDYYLYL